MSKAAPLRNDKFVLPDGAIIQVRVWLLPEPVPPCVHRYKYSLYYGKDGERVVGYDNERGKGDHRHVNGIETPYAFTTIDRLFEDFTSDVEAIRGEPL
ncbi:hypothetical protein ABAZ39_09605 [Azospirillum argentinense]|uniref:Uncharacterized protein n=1 Tax=Azospirillum argentinense TaxID=2970906 RepID=A0A060DHB0_9PROT|nr:DUF6516 family protein [Azospirillum argentinense]AIB12252.1 hypothetical protein ABAZ39_09605 [Azospirillum argentinense]EZQ09101.1 hypothetical protein ABAZ39_11030 [Azospirillum argentinense]